MPDITPMTDAELEDTRKNARSRFDPTLRLLATIDALKKELAEAQSTSRYFSMRNERDELRAENERLRAALDWLADQLSPSMFPDHGIGALKRIAAEMRSVRPGAQRAALDFAIAAGRKEKG